MAESIIVREKLTDRLGSLGVVDSRSRIACVSEEVEF
jgi:hypothetical protein